MKKSRYEPYFIPEDAKPKCESTSMMSDNNSCLYANTQQNQQLFNYTPQGYQNVNPGGQDKQWTSEGYMSVPAMNQQTEFTANQFCYPQAKQQSIDELAQCYFPEIKQENGYQNSQFCSQNIQMPGYGGGMVKQESCNNVMNIPPVNQQTYNAFNPQYSTEIPQNLQAYPKPNSMFQQQNYELPNNYMYQMQHRNSASYTNIKTMNEQFDFKNRTYPAVKEEFVQKQEPQIQVQPYIYLLPELGRSVAEQFLEIENRLCSCLSGLTFPLPVTHVYNPLTYAAEPHKKFVRNYGNTRKQVLFVGMNPGPFGMAQTGVPFGVVSLVRDWMNIEGSVERPPAENPKRPITGFQCSRKEVSGSRFWGYFKKKCATPEAFFKNCFIYNICPLVFMNNNGKNVTPPQIPCNIRNILNDLCDQAFVNVIQLLGVHTVIGIGKYAMDRAKKALQNTEFNVRIESIIHPSPANPTANKGWELIVENQLTDMNILPLIQNIESESENKQN